ncbi:hypothetical protein ACQI5H_07990 [Mycobacterium heidelbergense]|uniref:hypothetical protein n=1 Tax=Mycobacterium heidelbergense TaxID=53376 RepID=UPI003CE79223
MLTTAKTVVPDEDAAATFAPDRSAAATEAQRTIAASPSPVLISEREVMFATAAAGATSQTVATRRPWIAQLWQRLSAALDSLDSYVEREPRRYYARRPLYIENAAMAREMERL